MVNVTQMCKNGQVSLRLKGMYVVASARVNDQRTGTFQRRESQGISEWSIEEVNIRGLGKSINTKQRTVRVTGREVW